MRQRLTLSLLICTSTWLTTANAQQINDNNTPLHLMKPQYTTGYGVPAVEDVKHTMDRVLRYIDAETPAALEDRLTGREVTRMQDINASTQLKQGGFRLTSYEWGVTYSGVLSAYEATGDKTYRDYATKRQQLLATIAPYFQKVYAENKRIDGNIRRVIDPHALDDAGAVCCSMIKAELMGTVKKNTLRLLIDNYTGYIMDKEYRLGDGTFARLRPKKNTVWLDDMFMGIPAVAYMGRLTGNPRYYDEAARQIMQFASRMWVETDGLFRHGWVENVRPTATDGTVAPWQGSAYHPAFYWARANGWAILTLCEVLDVLPSDHPQRQAIAELLSKHAASLSRRQHHTGFWHQLLDRSHLSRNLGHGHLYLLPGPCRKSRLARCRYFRPHRPYGLARRAIGSERQGSGGECLRRHGHGIRCRFLCPPTCPRDGCPRLWPRNMGGCRDYTPAQATTPEDERLGRAFLPRRGAHRPAYLQLRRENKILKTVWE